MPSRPFGGRIHQDAKPVALSQINEIATGAGLHPFWRGTAPGLGDDEVASLDLIRDRNG